MDKKSPSEKEENLRDLIRSFGSAVVAFSGGVDSSLLAKIAEEELGSKVVSVTATSPTYPEWDYEDAEKVADEIGINHLKIDTNELENEEFTRNPEERCYYCKKNLLKELEKVRESFNFEKILEGTNKDDYSDYRPGIKAIEEFGERVASPLYEVGLSKNEIREMARKLKIKTAEKPASPCLASRIPYGTQISRKKLKRIEKSEKYLRKLDFKTVRVRDHGKLARIEVSQDKIPEVFDLRGKIKDKLRKIGYRYISLDLDGYRTGSLNPER